MEDPESDWETREDYDDDDGWEDSGKMGGWVLDKGLTLGKRILVTGFVMTSAPIVLPPVLIISAIGFVCSLPYGFFLASYACTEKLTRQLLPVATTSDDTVECPPRLVGCVVHDDGNDVGSTYSQRGFSRGEKPPLFRALDFDVEENERKNEVGQSMYEEEEKPTGETDVVGGLGLGGGVRKKDVEVDENLGGNAKEEQKQFEVTSICIDEGIAGGEVVDEKQIASDKNTNEAARVRASRNGALATTAKNVEQNGKRARGFSESKKDEAIKEEEKKPQGAKGNKSRKGIAKGMKQVEAKKEKEVSRAGEAVTTPAGQQQSDADSKEKGGRMLSSYVVHKMADPLEIAISPEANDLAQTEINPAESAFDKDLYSEAEIWKHIDAVRKIVGCTTPRHDTSVKELKALYIFAGVEAPTSFKDVSDLVEVNHKLRFLMSIVGVK